MPKPVVPQRLSGFQKFYIEFVYSDRDKRMGRLIHPLFNIIYKKQYMKVRHKKYEY